MSTPPPTLPTIRALLAHAQPLYRQAQVERLPVASAYNVFSLLGIHEQEVKHSALLADLLNPCGQHGLGAVFLTTFLRHVGVPARAPSSWRVTSEEAHRYGRWDIALHGQTHGRPALILIENKINAAESHQQLDRYLLAAQEHAGSYAPADTWLIFLTPDGRAPQSCRRPNGATLLAWSYHQHIRLWLATCLPLARSQPRLHSVLEQYLDLLTTYHHHHVQQNLSQKLAAHLLQHNLLAEADALRDALVQARIELQLLFWQELEQEMQRLKLPLALELSDHYCRERITDCYRKARSTRFYGIAIELLNQARDQKQLVLYVEMGKHTLEFGVYFYQQGHYKSAADLRRSKFGRDQLQQFADQLGLAVEADGALLNPPLAKCPLPFVPFELEAMQRLAQPAERQTLVKAVAQEAKKLYAKFPRA